MTLKNIFLWPYTWGNPSLAYYVRTSRFKEQLLSDTM